MSRKRSFKLASCLSLFLAIFTPPAVAQGRSQLPPPLSLSGTLTAGFYRAAAKDGISTSNGTALSSLRLNISGYFHHPKFLTFDVKPQLSLGRQSTETLFPDGRGISATATFLGGSLFPLTISYTRLSRQVVTFGTLDRLAGLAADTSQSALTASWRLRLKHLPVVSVSFSKYSDKYEPFAAVASQSENRARVFSVDLQDRRWGWILDSQFRLERTRTDLLDLFRVTRTPFHMKRDQRELRLSAARDFTSALRVSFLGGQARSRNEVVQRFFDQDYFYLTGNAYWHRGKKLSGSVRGGFTRNLLGFQLGQPSAAAPPSTTSPLLLNSSQARVNLLSLSGQVHYALSRDFRLDAQLARDSTWVPHLVGPAAPASRLTAGQGGFSYSHDFRRWQLQARYALSLGRLRYDDVASSRTLGHHANASLTFWSVLGFELTASVQGQRQSTRDTFRLESSTWASDVSATRRLASGWKLRASFSFDKSAFDTRNTRFESDGLGFSFLLGHPLGEVAFNRQARTGLSFDPLLRRGIVPSTQAQTIVAAFPNLLAIPSSTNWTSITVTMRPFRKMTARFWWMSNSQDLAGRVGNHYVQWEGTVGYRFRLLDMEFGYVRYRQNLGFAEFSRNRFFFRVSREFRVF